METPEPSNTPKPTETPEPSKTPKPTETPEPSNTPKPTETPEPSKTPKPTETPEPSNTPKPTETPEPSKTPKPTETPEPSKTPKPTETPEPSKTPKPTETPEPSKTPKPTETPEPSKTPKPTETTEPSKTPKPTETPEPSKTPKPTETPEPSKTPKPTEIPEPSKTPKPTETPEPSKTLKPTETPEPSNTPKPTETPEPSKTPKPTETPEPSNTPKPTETPEPSKTPKPTETPEPSKTPKPTETPEPSKTPKPTETPEPSKTPKPTETPEPSKTPKPTETPEPSKTPKPTETPEPSKTPKPTETPEPSKTPKTPEPSKTPKQTKSPEPSKTPKQTESPEPSKTPKPTETPEPSKTPTGDVTPPPTERPTREVPPTPTESPSHIVTPAETSPHNAISKPTETPDHIETNKLTETAKPSESHDHSESHDQAENSKQDTPISTTSAARPSLRNSATNPALPPTRDENRRGSVPSQDSTASPPPSPIAPSPTPVKTPLPLSIPLQTGLATTPPPESASALSSPLLNSDATSRVKPTTSFPTTPSPTTATWLLKDHMRPQSSQACPGREERVRHYTGWFKFIDRDLTKGLTQFIQSRANNDDESFPFVDGSCKDDVNAIATDWANCSLTVDNPLEPWTCLRAPFEDPSCVAAALTNNPFNTTRGLASPSLYLKPDNCRRTCAFSYTWRELWVEESPYKGRVLHCSSGIDKKPPRGGDTSDATPNQFHCEGKASLAATGDDILVDVSVGPSASIVVHDLYIANPASVFHMPGYKDTHQTHLWLSSESWKIQDLFDVSSTVGAFNELDIPPADQVTFWRWKLENETSWHDWRANENVPLTCFATTIQFEAWTYCGAKLTDFSWTVYRHGHDRLNYLSTWFHSIWTYEKEPHCNIPHRDYSVIHLRPHPSRTIHNHEDGSDELQARPVFRVVSMTCQWKYPSTVASHGFEVSLLSEAVFAIALKETGVTTVHVDCDVSYYDNAEAKASSAKQSKSFEFERYTAVSPVTSSCRDTCALGSHLNPERRRPLPGQACRGNLVYESDNITIFHDRADLACCSKCTYKLIKCLPTEIATIQSCREPIKETNAAEKKAYTNDNSMDDNDAGFHYLEPPPPAAIVIPLADKTDNVARASNLDGTPWQPPQRQTRHHDFIYTPTSYPNQPLAFEYPSANTAPSNPPVKVDVFVPTQAMGEADSAVIVMSGAVVAIVFVVCVLVVFRVWDQYAEPSTDENYRQLQ
ncbi:unnamed protein product [Aphanomyces euteiches]